MWKKVPLFLSTPNFLTNSWFLLTRTTSRFIRVLISWSGVVCLFSVSAHMCVCKCVCEYSMWRPEVGIRIWANIFPLLPICCSFQQGFPAKFSYSLFLVSMLFWGTWKSTSLVLTGHQCSRNNRGKPRCVFSSRASFESCQQCRLLPSTHVAWLH